MGFYARRIVPRLIDLAMRNERLRSYRQQAVGAARGCVLEIGVGSGRNLPLYGPGVTSVCALDPVRRTIGSGAAADCRNVDAGLAGAGFGRRLAFSRSQPRHRRDDLDTVLDTTSAFGAQRDAACPQAGRKIGLCRTRPLAGTPDSSVAASSDAFVATCQRRLPSRSRYERARPRRRLSPRCDRNRLYERSEADDLHVSGTSERMMGDLSSDHPENRLSRRVFFASTKPLVTTT